MKSYYLINKEADLLDSFDLPELQMYPHILSWLLRMGKKEGVTPDEDWGKVKSLLMRVKNHISFHAHGVKPSEITVDFYSSEVKRLFHAVYGDGSQTWTNDWLDAFEAVKDEIDRQVGDNRAVCQYGAASGKRCDNCQCPSPLSEPERKEKALAGLAMFDESNTETTGDAGKPRFVVEAMIQYCGYGIRDTDTKIGCLYTESQETAVAFAELLNHTVAGLLNESQSDDVGMGNKALVKYLTAKVKQPNVLFWNEPDRETGYGSLLDAMEDAETGVPISEDDEQEQYVCNDCGARFDDNYDAAKHWVNTHMTAEWFTERFSVGIRLNGEEIKLLINHGIIH